MDPFVCPLKSTYHRTSISFRMRLISLFSLLVFSDALQMKRHPSKRSDALMFKAPPRQLKENDYDYYDIIDKELENMGETGLEIIGDISSDLFNLRCFIELLTLENLSEKCAAEVSQTMK